MSLAGQEQPSFEQYIKLGVNRKQYQIEGRD